MIAEGSSQCAPGRSGTRDPRVNGQVLCQEDQSDSWPVVYPHTCVSVAVQAAGPQMWYVNIANAHPFWHCDLYTQPSYQVARLQAHHQLVLVLVPLQHLLEGQGKRSPLCLLPGWWRCRTSLIPSPWAKKEKGGKWIVFHEWGAGLLDDPVLSTPLWPQKIWPGF